MEQSLEEELYSSLGDLKLNLEHLVSSKSW